MQKLYENFHIFYFQKRIISAETIRGNTVLCWSFQKAYKPVQQSRQQALRAYCTNVYTVRRTIDGKTCFKCLFSPNVVF